MGRILIWSVVLSLTVSLFLAACAGPSPAGNKVVEVGDMAPLTSFGGTVGQQAEMGVQDYVRYFNEEIGIPGVTLKFLWMDTAIDPSKAITAYHRFLERGVPCIFSTDSRAAEACSRLCERDQIPWIYAGTTEPLVYPPSWVYCFPPTYAEQFAVLCDFIMENWEKDRPPRVAFMGSESAWGREPIEQGTKYALSIGIEMLPPEFVEFVTLDATTQLLRLSAEEVDFVFIQGVVQTVGPVLKDAQRLGLLDKMKFCGNENGPGEQMIEMTGDVAEGYLIPKCYPWYDETEIPGIRQMVDCQVKYHGRALREVPYMTGYMGAGVACEAIRRAIEKTDYDNLSGPAIKEALESMKSFDLHGLATITYTPQDHTGSGRVRIYEIKGGNIVPVSDWREAPTLVP